MMQSLVTFYTPPRSKSQIRGLIPQRIAQSDNNSITIDQIQTDDSAAKTCIGDHIVNTTQAVAGNYECLADPVCLWFSFIECIHGFSFGWVVVKNLHSTK